MCMWDAWICARSFISSELLQIHLFCFLVQGFSWPFVCCFYFVYRRYLRMRVSVKVCVLVCIRCCCYCCFDCIFQYGMQRSFIFCNFVYLKKEETVAVYLFIYIFCLMRCVSMCALQYNFLGYSSQFGLILSRFQSHHHYYRPELDDYLR